MRGQTGIFIYENIIQKILKHGNVKNIVRRLCSCTIYIKIVFDMIAEVFFV